MAIEIVSFPMKNGGSVHSYVSLPEGIMFIDIKTTKSHPMAGDHSKFFCENSKRLLPLPVRREAGIL
jgi:hypothetical protein